MTLPYRKVVHGLTESTTKVAEGDDAAARKFSSKKARKASAARSFADPCAWHLGESASCSLQSLDQSEGRSLQSLVHPAINQYGESSICRSNSSLYAYNAVGRPPRGPQHAHRSNLHLRLLHRLDTVYGTFTCSRDQSRYPHTYSRTDFHSHSSTTTISSTTSSCHASGPSASLSFSSFSAPPLSAASFRL
jgi:hypothetical protein